MESKAHEPLVLCPAGFTVQRIDRYDRRSCGHSTCYPSACQRLKKFNETIKDKNDEHQENG